MCSFKNLRLIVEIRFCAPLLLSFLDDDDPTSFPPTFFPSFLSSFSPLSFNYMTFRPCLPWPARSPNSPQGKWCRNEEVGRAEYFMQKYEEKSARASSVDLEKGKKEILPFLLALLCKRHPQL